MQKTCWRCIWCKICFLPFDSGHFRKEWAYAHISMQCPSGWMIIVTGYGSVKGGGRGYMGFSYHPLRWVIAYAWSFHCRVFAGFRYMSKSWWYTKVFEKCGHDPLNWAPRCLLIEMAWECEEEAAAIQADPHCVTWGPDNTHLCSSCPSNLKSALLLSYNRMIADGLHRATKDQQFRSVYLYNFVRWIVQTNPPYPNTEDRQNSWNLNQLSEPGE